MTSGTVADLNAISISLFMVNRKKSGTKALQGTIATYCPRVLASAGAVGCTAPVHLTTDYYVPNPEHLVVLSAGPIPHNSIHLLKITTDFVTLY